MKKTNNAKSFLGFTMAVVFAAGFFTESAEAQKLGNNGWRWYNWGSDYFTDTAIGWQWKVDTRYEWEIGKRRDGSQWWGYFRNDNVVMDGSKLTITPRWHGQQQSAGGRTYQYSGGWLQSKANWFTEGQYQANTRVDWNFADVWPTFWVVTGGNPSRVDELDIMEYQNDHLNQTHHINPGRPGKRSSPRVWNRWNVPTWEWNWAKARVRSNTNWAVRGARSFNAQFFINAKKEHTSTLGPVTTGMSMVFSASPHIKQLPNPGNYPKFNVNWVETHIP